MEVEHEAMMRVLRRYKIQDERVLAAMAKVRRSVYIPQELRDRADPYGDHPCPIGFGQTLSQPFIVAYMTQRMELLPGARVLEIGTGSGYQAAVLAEMGAQVYSVELVPELAEHACKVLAAEGYGNVVLKAGDGYEGWPENAPFDAIIVTCAPTEIPPALTEQLKEGGRMILPVGAGVQQLILLEKTSSGFRKIPDLYVRFVPMVGGADSGTLRASF